jgi:hypothetical protein
MSVRKLGLRYSSLGGRVIVGPAHSVAHDSALERDFLTLQAFDLRVENIVAQPLVVPYSTPDGHQRTYVPDAYVQYRRDRPESSKLPHLLCEVKYRRDLRAKWRQLRPRFRAAYRYAKERGWQFRIFTEIEIRTTYLTNASFLMPYRQVRWDEGIEQALMDRMRLLREADANTLLESFFSDPWKRAELLPQVWRLLAWGRFGADLTWPLTMTTLMWAND